MSSNGADRNEMDFLNRPTPDDAELAAFADSLRATLVAPLPASQVAAMAPRLAEEARIAHAQGPTTERRAEARSGSRLRTFGQLALGFCLVPLVAAGLATAGVNLPGPAQSAFESVGIDLPNQDETDTDDATAPPAASPTDDDPAAPPAGTPGAAKAKPGKGNGKGKNNGKGNGNGNGKGNANGQANGQAQAPGQSGSAGSNGNGGSASSGNSSSAPGHNKSGGSSASGNGSTKAKSGGGGNAVGQTDAAPPGQANKPASPGNSAAAPGKNK